MIAGRPCVVIRWRKRGSSNRYPPCISLLAGGGLRVRPCRMSVEEGGTYSLLAHEGLHCLPTTQLHCSMMGARLLANIRVPASSFVHGQPCMDSMQSHAWPCMVYVDMCPRVRGR
ncbi:hypothetical protein Dimus_035340, partial [Dionaea muscipula]